MPTATSTKSPLSSPSTSTIHFPSPIPRKDQPNTHPYAIKTSSTAILSRSNSTSSHASVGPHHYVPTSPSPTALQHSPTKLRPSRHRYSRSLTSEMPPALPPPPGASPSSSPMQTQLDDEDDTPRKRMQRADTMPSSAGAPLLDLDLPDDPTTWKPSQLSIYLSSTLRAGDAKLPVAVAKDIVSFVRENRITGKIFLRLSEDDLIQFGLNQLWRTALLTTSRNLRQTVFPSKARGFTHEDDEDPGNVSSSSGASSSGERATRRSRYYSTPSSSGGDCGKVKGMVDSLEKSTSGQSAGSSDERIKLETPNDERRSISPTKLPASNASFLLHKTTSPTKHSRPLPHRATVNDLFNSTNTDSDVSVEEKEDDPTIKHVAKRNGRETRLLPFPPTHASVISPMHTGSGSPLPLSPDRTGASYVQQPPADYEMGFRVHTHSPHSQVYVVRHNPASPSNAIHSNDKKTKRLLPFPPVTREAQLHHPKPMRLVGTNSGVAESDSGDENGHVRHHGMTTSSTEGYETAQETQSEGDSIAPNGSAQCLEHTEEEEPSIQELLSVEQGIKPISGVEAWEMELGETVKRIGGDKIDEKRRGSVAEISRKAGRNPTSGRSGMSGTKRDRMDSLKRSGIIGLFDPQDEVRPFQEEGGDLVDIQRNGEDTVEEGFAMREKCLEEKERTIATRELEVGRREETVAVQERNLLEQKASEEGRLEYIRRNGEVEQSLSMREKRLEEKEWTIASRELEVGHREEVVCGQERGLCEREASEEERLSTTHKQLQDAGLELEDRERALQFKEKAVGLKEMEVARREKDVQLQELKVKQWEKKVEVKETALEERIAKDALAASVSPWTIMPVDLLRRCWSLIGSSSSPSTTISGPESPHHRISSWAIRRDILFGPYHSGGYFVLMSIGVCVVALRVLGKKAGGFVGRG